MQAQTTSLPPGLYLVSTPIGAARDITLRALDTLASADVIAAEDTRTARHLMGLHGIAVGGRPLVAYHEHSPPGARARLIDMIAAGKSVAYVSEAGTPLIADPGFQLGRAAIAEGLAVQAVPGPSALLSALVVAGLPTDRFFFAGFAPSAKGARRRLLDSLAGVEATLVFYESPRRLHGFLTELSDSFGEERPAAVCRELTKKFEEVRRGALSELASHYAEHPAKGEIVIVIDRAAPAEASDMDLDAALRAALATDTLKDAVARVVADLGAPRRVVYQRALALSKAG